jgi:hypothetical protein
LWKKFKEFSFFSVFEEPIQEDADPNFSESFFAKIDLDTKEGMNQKLARQKISMAISFLPMVFI